MRTIDVAQEFSKAPFGRYKSDGDFSAERFREEVLKPALTEDDVVEVDFTKVSLGVGSSFLEEAFGGLVRAGLAKKFLLSHIKIKAKMDFYEDLVKEFINSAQPTRETR